MCNHLAEVGQCSELREQLRLDLADQHIEVDSGVDSAYCVRLVRFPRHNPASSAPLSPRGACMLGNGVYVLELTAQGEKLVSI